MTQPNKHYIVGVNVETGTYSVVCLAHTVATELKQVEAEALSDALNLRSCLSQADE